MKEAQPGEETLTWSELVYDGRTFIFSKALAIKVNGDKREWELESEDLEIVAFGHTRSEAESVFREMFAVRWDRIAMGDDHGLSGDARELKRKMLTLVKERQ